MLSSKMFFLNVSHGMGIIIIMTWSRAWSWAWTWKYRTWKFCTWKCHTVHIDVHVYFFAVNLVLVGLSEIFSSVFEAIKKLPVSNCSKTYAELYLKELARALFADTYWNVFLNSLGPYVQMCCFLLFFILITFSSLVSFHISLL
jgi:hypothetical protein